MAVENPTFSELWYRVAELKVALAAGVRVRRQYFRGQLWFVLDEPMTGQFTRVHEAGWRLVSLLDGRRTVAAAWQICQNRMGDSAPTQGELLALLGQLYQLNLLQADQLPDVKGLFRRGRQKTFRRARGHLGNLLFPHFPLWDPDGFLNRWVWLFGKLFTPAGLIVWLILLMAGAVFVWSGPSLTDEAQGVLAPANLWVLYACLMGLALLHELGHAFACKALGGGQVHALGVMLLGWLFERYDVSAETAG